MIETNRVVRLIRHQEGDLNETKFSDYDILMAINQTLRYLSTSLANKGSQYLEKTMDFDEEEVNNKTRSNYEVFGNEAPVYGNTTYLADLNGDVEETAIVDFAEDGVPLPDGCTSIISVQELKHHAKLKPATSQLMLVAHGYRMYYIAGERIYTKVKKFRLNYYRPIPEQQTTADTIDLPPIFLDPIVKISRIMLDGGDNDAMTQAVTTEVNRVLPRRRYSNSRERMPFYL